MKKFDVALDFGPKNALVLRDSGEVALRLGDAQQALNRLRRAAQIEPRDAQTISLLAQAHAAVGDLNAAAKGFEQALQLSPQQPDATMRLADVLVKLGRTDDAIARLSAASSAWEKVNDPKAQVASSIILTRMSDIAAASGQFARAIDGYNRALNTWSNNYEAHKNLAWFLATHRDGPQRNGKRALDLARRACELKEPDHAALGTLAAAYAANGQIPEAVETAQRAQELARKSDDGEAVAALERQLNAYRNGKPYIAQ
jgi:tetratricopeptide (TPR) repeat protein